MYDRIENTKMKKFIPIILSAIVAICGIACSDNDTTYNVSGDKYVGTLTTERNTDGYADIVQEDVTFYVDVAKSGNSLDLYMPDVTFFYTSSYSMPRIDIAIFSIPQTSTGVYSAESVVIKEIEDHEVLVNTYLNAYSGISNIELTLNDDNSIYIEFDCKLNGVTRTVTYSATKD